MANAVEAWKQRVEAHHAQSIRTQQAMGWSSAGQGGFFASLFSADPRRTGDPVLDLLCRQIPAGATVLDVGAGAGRFALPLALRGHRVTVVEPAGAMVDTLRAQADTLGVEIAVVPETWEVAEVEPADVVLAAHVVYGVVEIDIFLRKLHAHARDRVLLPSFMESPPSQVAPFWPPVHGEERHNLPGLSELLPVLWELEIYPDLTMFAPDPAQSVHDRETIVALLRHFLYVRPGTEQDRRLTQVMPGLTVEAPEGLAIRDVRPRRQGLLSWQPAWKWG